jgi:YfiH family protein
VVTADCVPVLLAGPAGIAAVHAGWRGVVAGVVGAAVAAMREARRLVAGQWQGTELAAWIGPAIGPCCYETGGDVAAQVAAASEPGVVSPGPAGRPHLDLQAAVQWQLAAAGVAEIQTVALCTRCAAEQLHSYRRDGRGAGRNHSFIWRE